MDNKDKVYPYLKEGDLGAYETRCRAIGVRDSSIEHAP